MAAPAATARQTPGGIRLPDGFRTKITFALLPALIVEEVGVKPAGVDNNEPIVQDSMWNTRYTLVREQQLISLMPATFTCYIDPLFVDTMLGLCGVAKSGSTAQVITETFPDGSTRAYYGFLKSVDFEEFVRGTRPKATITIQPTNWDPVNRIEAGPVTVSVAGS